MGLLDEFYAPDYSRLKRGQFRQDTPKMREYAANVPVDLARGTVAGLLGLLSDTLNFAPAYSPKPMEQFGDFDYAPSQKVPFGSEELLKTLPLAPAADNPVGRVAGQIGTFAPMVPVQAARLAGRAATEVGKFVAPKAGQLAENYMQRMGMMPSIVSKEGGGLLGDAAVAKAAGIKKKSKSVISQPRMSAAEARDAGYWHSIGAGKKLPIPISEMTARLEDAGLLSPKLKASPEAMQNAAIFPFHGDRSAAGKNLLGIGDTNFETPVYLEGGYDFMRANAPNREIWAADKGSAQGLQNRIDEAAKIGGGDVFGVYSAMGPDSMNFNTMMSDALLEQIRAGKISKKNIAAFDREVASLRPEWKGVMNPESRAQLESNGALRHVFVDRMQLDDFQKVGFPNIAYTRYGITDPLLLNEPMYSGGLAIGKMQPGSKIITNPMSPHKTYNTQLTGDYIGGFEQSVPKEVLYPDWYKKRRIDNTPISGDVRSFQLSNPIQPTNQEWLDGVMQYLANQKSLLE